MFSCDFCRKNFPPLRKGKRFLNISSFFLYFSYKHLCLAAALYNPPPTAGQTVMPLEQIGGLNASLQETSVVVSRAYGRALLIHYPHSDFFLLAKWICLWSKGSPPTASPPLLPPDRATFSSSVFLLYTVNSECQRLIHDLSPRYPPSLFNMTAGPSGRTCLTPVLIPKVIPVR